MISNEENNPCVKSLGWWIFKHQHVIHEYERVRISKFMSCSETYHVHYKCKNCGATKTKKFVKKDELILSGVPVNYLEKI